MSRISFAHKIWAVALFCGVIAWLSGPAGRLLVALLLLLFAPGYLIERACCRTQNTIDMTSSMPRRLVGFVRPTLWLGLSLSSIALLYAWTTAFNLSLTTEVVQFL